MSELTHRADAALLSGLSQPLQALLGRAAALAQVQQVTLWLVGGVVRDLLRSQPIERDLDLMVEGDAVAFAHMLAADLEGTVSAAHHAFGTATVILEQFHAGAMAHPLALDLARTRVEQYPQPAALPVVQPAGIDQDLRRRDFSINALALPVRTVAGHLAPTTLLDPFGGRHDLAAGRLRVLHDASFDDDPTRILRGLRLAARLGFHLEPHTQTLLAEALARSRLEATSPDRIRTELCLALAEPQPEEVLRLADAWGVTPHIFAPLHWSAALAARCAHARATDAISLNPLHYAGLLTYDLTAEERNDLAVRYRLPGDAVRLLRELDALQAIRDQLTPTLRNSELDHLLQPFGAVTLAVVRAAEPPPIPDVIAYYLTHLRPVTQLLDGHALQRLGISPGPQLGQILRELRAARLDNLVATRADEEAWAMQRWQELQGAE
jgi:tRNA nucleotidyltransferase (CCA-adding enzyme)